VRRSPKVLLLALAAVLLAAAVIAFSNLRQQKPTADPVQQALDQARAEARRMGAVEDGKVLIVYYCTEDSRHCLAFESEVLPRLQGNFGDKLMLIRSKAWPVLPVPTLIIRGQAEFTEFRDLSYDKLQADIRQALGSDATAK
jgi:hypothetical protein